MRYSTLVQDTIGLARYGDAEAPSAARSSRYSDEQLYALAMYVYALRPPDNPNRFDAVAERGKKLFAREGCGGCHTPPLYTNNKLIPVDGFTPSDEDKATLAILERRVGTDPRYALQTRKGTGYYKVPSLKGSGIAGRSNITGRLPHLKTGSIRLGCAAIMCRRVMPARPAMRVGEGA